MEHIILGLLLLKSMTAYEISNFINKNLALICSGSSGSIQIALKKLLKNECVSINELLEGGINKKFYSITDKGNEEFQSWICSPMQTNKVKNMELSKVFFLGFSEPDKRILVIENYINQLTDVKNILQSIKDVTNTMFEENINKLNVDNPEDVIKYQIAILEYGIASADFEINWYTNLIDKLEK